MKKLWGLGLVAAIAAIATAGWWWQQQGSGSLLVEVPADTLLLAGNLQPRPADQPEYFNPALAITYRDSLLQFYHHYRGERLRERANQPNDAQAQQQDARLAFAVALASDLLTSLTGGDSALPLDNRQPFALFMVGGLPVLRFSADADAFNQYLQQQAQQQGLSLQSQEHDQQPYLLLPLVETAGRSLALALVSRPGQTRLALVSDALDDESLGLLLGSRLPQHSLADSSGLVQAQQQLQLLPQQQFYFSFSELTRGLLQPDSNLFGRHLQQLAGDDLASSLGDWRQQSCAQEVQQLVDQMPMLIGGLVAIKGTGNQRQAHARGALLLTNPQLRQALGRLQGYVPALLSDTRQSPPLLAFGYGLNAGEMAPAIQQLWQLFTAEPYQCPPLETLRSQLAEQNPAMLAMASGMINGLQGVQLLFNDLQLDPGNDEQPLQSLDLLLGISGNNLRTLWGMTAAFNPLHATLPWPKDEQPVAVPLPDDWPTNLPLWFKVKGKHAFFYSGEQAARQANQISNEQVSSNGLFAIAANYERLATKVGELLPASNALLAHSSTSLGCAEQQELLNMLTPLRMQLWANVLFNDIGLLSNSWQHWPVHAHLATSPHALGGRYQTLLLDEQCQPQPDGEETLASDGSSHYRASSDDDHCVDYENRGQWQRQGNLLVWDYRDQRQAETGCLDEQTPWNSTLENVVESCLIISEQADYFDCLFSSDDKFIMRYQRHQG